jgi:hypothetical protein
MAVRLTVSIPDALAKRMEPYRPLLSPSELMQTALIERLDDLEGVGPDEVWKDRIASFARNLSRRKKARLIAELQRKPDLSAAEKEFLLEVGKAFRPYPTSRRM